MGKKYGRRHVRIEGDWKVYSPRRDHGRWAWRLVNLKTGKRQFYRAEHPRLETAASKFEEWFEGLRLGKAPKPDTRIDEALSEWFDLNTKNKRESTRQDLRNLFKPSTIRNRDGTEERRPGFYARTFAKLSVTHVHEVTYDHVEQAFKVEWADSKGRTKFKHLWNLTRFFNWCRKRGYCSRSPTEDFDDDDTQGWSDDIRAARDTGKVLSYEQTQRLLSACLSEYKAGAVGKEGGRRDGSSWAQTYKPPEHVLTALLIPLRSGLRPGNVVRLRWRHLNLNTENIGIPAAELKTKASFSAPMHPELAAYLREVLRRRTEELGHAPKPDDYVLQVKEFKQSLEGAMKRAGLDKEEPYISGANPGFRPYDLRHTFANQAKLHCRADAVRQLLGHAKTTMTDRYGTLSFEQVREDVAKIPRLFPPRKAERKTEDA